MSRRCRHEVVRAVLEAVETPAKRWTVCYRANLNWYDASKWLKALAEKGLVSEQKQGRSLVYGLEEDGRKWLELMRALEGLDELPLEEAEKP